jgi:plastocyanin
MRHWRLLSICVAMAAACGGSGGGGGGATTGPTNSNPGGTGNPGGGVTNTINLADQSFNPASVTVPVGTTITWQWPNTCTDGYGGYYSCPTHNIVFDDASNITSGTQSSGTFAHTFTAAGTFKYHCAIHGSAMSGQIVVQ